MDKPTSPDEIIRIQAEHIERLTDDLRHSRMATQRYRNQLDEAYDMLIEQQATINAYMQERSCKNAISSLCRSLLANIRLAADRVHRWVTR